MVRGVEMVGTPLTAINKLVAAGNDVGVFNDTVVPRVVTCLSAQWRHPCRFERSNYSEHSARNCGTDPQGAAERQVAIALTPPPNQSQISKGRREASSSGPPGKKIRSCHRGQCVSLFVFSCALPALSLAKTSPECGRCSSCEERIHRPFDRSGVRQKPTETHGGERAGRFRKGHVGNDQGRRHRECDTDDRGVKVAKESGARFVVFSKRGR